MPDPFAGEWSATADPKLGGMPFGECLDGLPAEDFASGRLQFEKRPGVFETETFRRNVPVCRTCFAKRPVTFRIAI
jgi:hypothetical protein